MESRTASVPPHRLVGWLQRFQASHGEAALQRTVDTLTVVAGDGSTARIALSGIQPGETISGAVPADGAEPVSAFEVVQELASAAALNSRIGMVLVRRGGYAIGVARNSELIASKTGTRYVQSRTAAGGWSQQRFARRRANQSNQLVGAAAEHAQRLILGAGVQYMVYGGDRALCAEAAGHHLLMELTSLPQLPFLNVPDPRQRVLQRAAENLNSFTITVTNS